MAGAVEHDYHILPPSPWPFLAGIATMVWGAGMVILFAGLTPRNGENPLAEFFFARGLDTIQGKSGDFSGVVILIFGSLFAAYVMYGWWRDVAAESARGEHTPVIDLGLRYGMIMFIMQEAMFFVGWFWMFFEVGLFHKFRAGWNPDVLENPADYASWPPPSIEPIDPWHLPLINTLILLLSGTTVTWGHHALIHGDRKGAKWGIGLTVVLGAIFIGVQGLEYYEAFIHRNDDGIHGSFWLSTNVYGSTFFLATGFHGLHVLIGAIFLAVIWGRLMNGGMSSEKHFGLEAAAWYWHFVDVVWLFLFAFVYVAFG